MKCGSHIALYAKPVVLTIAPLNLERPGVRSTRSSRNVLGVMTTVLLRLLGRVRTRRWLQVKVQLQSCTVLYRLTFAEV